MTQASSRTGLTPRDLINVGIFTAIYFVFMFVAGMLGIAGPPLMLVGHAVSILGNGIVVALYLSRVPKVGALTVMGLIVGLLMTLTGHPWIGIIITPVLGLIADLIARSGHFRSPLRNIIAYTVFSLWFLSPMLPVLWDSAGYRAHIAEGMGEDYANRFMQLFNAGTLGFVGIYIVVLALLGGWLGQQVLRRQFKRAGVA